MGRPKGCQDKCIQSSHIVNNHKYNHVIAVGEESSSIIKRSNTLWHSALLKVKLKVYAIHGRQVHNRTQ
jgi:hypothetical protein